MIEFHTYKYQGAGNDFVILDNRENIYNNITTEEVAFLCNRRFGIGADGLMLLGTSNKYSFSMRYFNSDGIEATMCGNGGRCLVAFAAHMGMNKFDFEAIDGFHTAEILDYTAHRCIVKLKMIDVEAYSKHSNCSYFLNTGSPHYVEFVESVKEYPVVERGAYWRHHKDFKATGGTNVNFVEIRENSIAVRTFERGVEDETLACGTGITASAIAAYLHSPSFGYSSKIESDTVVTLKYNIEAEGDKLAVEFTYNKKNRAVSDIYLTGPATFVFECKITL